MKIQLLSEEQLQHKAPFEMNPFFITIHEVNSSLGAKSVADYISRDRGSEAYHVLVDDKEEIQIISFNRNAWHAGDGNGPGNRSSIAIGICRALDHKTNKYDLAVKRTSKVIARIIHQYGISIDNVKTHNDWSGEDCPHRLIAEERLGQLITDTKKEVKKYAKN